jgi:dinuclear metal center YbgI/SA1388 family protein
MIIQDIVLVLEKLAPPSLQESYDNVGLLTGNKNWNCKGVLCTLDVTDAVVQEAITKKCNLIVAHHPIIFSGLKKINGNNYVERIVIAAIKNDIAIYAIHTNLDNVLHGVNAKIADALGLINRNILNPKPKQLKKLYTYVPQENVQGLKDALFETGAGEIGNYSDCSFSVIGQGTFKGNKLSNPVVGKKNVRTYVDEVKVEIIFPTWLEQKLVRTLKTNHPYEEVAYEIINIENSHQNIGSGLIGELPKPISEKEFLGYLKKQFKLTVVRHTALLNKKVKHVALCGGSGSFLISNALAAKADVYITADVKYHEFFDADGRMLIADIGHWESEQYTITMIFEHLRQNFPNFAVLKTGVKTNSVHYFV